MRSTEHLPRGRCQFLERLYDLAEIFERGVGVLKALPQKPDAKSEARSKAAAALSAHASGLPMPAPPVQRRRSVEPCLAELIDGLKLKPAQAESLEQLLDEHEVHDLATAQILDADDFKEIGIKVGTRKKLLERLASSTSEA